MLSQPAAPWSENRILQIATQRPDKELNIWEMWFLQLAVILTVVADLSACDEFFQVTGHHQLSMLS